MCCCRIRNSLLVSIALIFASPGLVLADGPNTHLVAAAPHASVCVPKELEEWSTFPDPAILDGETEKRLKEGEVVVEAVDKGSTKFVLARICIEQSPADVWPILANPYEFENKICPKMKSVELISERDDLNVIKCGWNICVLLPKITYTVESKFERQKQVQFRRVAGTFKDFRGSWILRPLSGGKSCEVLYSMFIDPGIPLPKWLVREALKNELPHTLIALRERVRAIYAEGALPEARHPSIVEPVAEALVAAAVSRAKK